jgi:hypothetical protein
MIGGSRPLRVVEKSLNVVAFTEFGEKFTMAIMGDVKRE